MGQISEVESQISVQIHTLLCQVRQKHAQIFEASRKKALKIYQILIEFYCQLGPYSVREKGKNYSFDHSRATKRLGGI